MADWNPFLEEKPANLYRRVLTDVLDMIVEVSGRLSNIRNVKDSLREISKNYTKGVSVASGNFRSDWRRPANRCAYVFLYFMQHCHLVHFSLDQYNSQILNSWRKKEAKGSLKVCSIGGGPGSDLVGLMTFLRKIGVSLSCLDCLVLDLFPDWKDTWDKIEESVDGKFTVNYKECDVVRDSDLPVSTLEFIRDADMLTLVKFFSAVSAFFREKPERGNLLRSMLGEIKAGCFVLYIDNIHVSARFEQEFAAEVGLCKVFEFTGEIKLPVGSGEYSDTVMKYCRDFDYNPLRSCEVLIQIYVKVAGQ